MHTPHTDARGVCQKILILKKALEKYCQNTQIQKSKIKKTNLPSDARGVWQKSQS